MEYTYSVMCLKTETTTLYWYDSYDEAKRNAAIMCEKTKKPFAVIKILNSCKFVEKQQVEWTELKEQPHEKT